MVKAHCVIHRGIDRVAAILAEGTPCCATLRQRILWDNRSLRNVALAPYVEILSPYGSDETVVEVTTRIWQAGTKYRRESLDGKPIRISDGVTGWHIAYYPGEYGYRSEDPEPTATITRRPLPAEQYQVPPLIPSEERSFPQLGTAEQVGQDDRTCLLVTMATSQSDERPGWSYIVDAKTGFLLRSQFRDGPEYREWTDLVIGCNVNNDVFTWNGPCRMFGN